jgi:hypothetical protein
VPSTCQFFIDVQECYENGQTSTTNPTPLSHGPTGFHDVNLTLDGIDDLSPDGENDLVQFSDGTEPILADAIMNHRPAIRYASGKGLRTLVFDGTDVTASADADSATIEITGYTVQASDVGKTLVITGGEYFVAGTYTVESADPAINTESIMAWQASPISRSAA